jgi:hypothetical protein
LRKFGEIGRNIFQAATMTSHSDGHDHLRSTGRGPFRECSPEELGAPPTDCGEAGYTDVIIDENGIAVCNNSMNNCSPGYECDDSKVFTPEMLDEMGILTGQCVFMCCRPMNSSSSSSSSVYPSSSSSSYSSSYSSSSYPSSSSSPPSSSLPSSSSPPSSSAGE